MSASVKSLVTTLTSRGPHRVLRGNLAVAGLPGVVFTPESGTNLPAVAFGHAWLTKVGNYRELLQHLASWGIVAAAPDTERGPIPSHLGLGTDLLTTLDICTGVRLGNGSISVHPEKLALAGHGMGAGAAAIAAAQRRVAAYVALFPAPTAPAAEELAPDLDIPAFVLGGEVDAKSVSSDTLPLAKAWGGPLVLRTLAGASHNGLIEGRRSLATFGIGKFEAKNARATRALLTGYLLHTLLGDKTYAAFADPEAEIPRTTAVDPHAPVEPEAGRGKIGLRQISQLVRR
ncbi:hypothetical protein [Nocardia sp. NPDC057227]|uniref:hypothetical protein n=1 Tax=Nocardia sp. NPDC057227 TaxID=3346056 RepID=UPI0036410537